MQLVPIHNWVHITAIRNKICSGAQFLGTVLSRSRNALPPGNSKKFISFDGVKLVDLKAYTAYRKKAKNKIYGNNTSIVEGFFIARCLWAKWAEKKCVGVSISWVCCGEPISGRSDRLCHDMRFHLFNIPNVYNTNNTNNNLTWFLWITNCSCCEIHPATSMTAFSILNTVEGKYCEISKNSARYVDILEHSLVTHRLYRRNQEYYCGTQPTIRASDECLP